MKTLILYQSKCGSTKAYAEDIAKATGADVYPLKGFRLKKMKDYDTIVFGGWVQGGSIQGLDKFLSEYESIKDKNVLIFSTGMAFPTSDGRSLLIEQNLLDMYHIRFYMLQGSFDIKKLRPLERILIQRSLTNLVNDPANLNQKESLEKLSSEPLVVYDHQGIDKIVRVINTLSLTVEVNVKDKA